MPGLSFSHELGCAIERGQKKITSRLSNEHNIKAGDILHLWVKQRAPKGTPNRRKIGEAKCLAVLEWIVSYYGVDMPYHHQDVFELAYNCEFEDAPAFYMYLAKLQGFDTWAAFCDCLYSLGITEVKQPSGEKLSLICWDEVDFDKGYKR